MNIGLNSSSHLARHDPFGSQVSGKHRERRHRGSSPRKIAVAAAVAMAVPTAVRAADYVFNPSIPPSGNVMDRTQYSNNAVPGSTAPDRLDIAGGFTGNFGSGTFANNLTLNTLYLGGDSDGPVGGDTGGVPNTAGNGTLNQSGGTVTVNTWTVLGMNSSANPIHAGVGTYNLSGGTYHQGATYNTIVGQGGLGIFNISNGAAATIDSALNIGFYGAGNTQGRGVGNGTVTISGATSILTVGQDVGSNHIINVGYEGAGTLNVQGGLVRTFADLSVGTSSGAVGVVNQSGGTVKVGAGAYKWALIGDSAGATGTYNLSGGNLNVNGQLYVGHNGVGTFNQTNGAVVAVGQIFIGDGVGSSGVYTMSGGSMQPITNLFVGNNGSGTLNLVGNAPMVNVPNSEYVGYSGSGLVNQSAGTQTIDSLFLGYNASATGSVNHTGGTLNANNVTVGQSGNGTYNQSGGSNVISGNLLVASGAGSHGNYAMSGGNLSTGGIAIANDSGSAGVFSQSAGAITDNGLFTLGGVAINSTGTFSLSGNGTLNVLGAASIGAVGQGTFTQTGGSSAFKSGLAIAGGPWSTGTVVVSAGIMSAASLSFSGSGGLSGGIGTLTVNGGAVSIAGQIQIFGSPGNQLVLNGGNLSSGPLMNAAQYLQTGGTASLGSISGTGAISIGGGAGSALATVTSFSQASVTINSAGKLVVAPGPARYTNTASSLLINGSGVLDLNNHNLLTNTPAATIRQYLINGYNADSNGNARWNGTGGINSSLAAKNLKTFSVGYATAADNKNTGLGLTGNQVFVKPTIPGDATLNGVVDIGDLNVVLSNFLSGNPGTWGTGDFTYAGQTDISDLNIVLSNYLNNSPFPSASSSARTLTASTAKISPSASSSAVTLSGAAPVASSATSAPVTANTVELDVDPVSGDVKLNGNGAKIASIQITSNGRLVPLSWNSLGDQGVPNWTDATDRTTTGLAEYDFKFNTKHDSKLINGVIDYGNIFASGAAHDLVFQYGLVQPDGTTLSTITGNVVYAPEPTSLALLGLGTVGLMARRRKSCCGIQDCVLLHPAR